MNILYIAVFSLAIGVVYCVVAGLMALDMVPRKATGAALGLVGISSYVAAGIQDTQGVFHVRTPGGVGDVEGPGRVGVEERLQDLADLVLAGIVGFGEDGDLQIVREPGGKPFRITVADVFGNRNEHVVIAALGLCSDGEGKQQDDRRNLCQSFHDKSVFIANTEPLSYFCISMKITLLTVGRTDVDWVKESLDLYGSRLSHYVPFSVVEIPQLKGTASLSKEQIKEKEGEAILRILKGADHVVLLDERGKEYRSVEFAGVLQGFMSRSSADLVFVTGGAYGFSKAVYDRADGKMSLSKMTFSHQMVRTIFAEQLYRAFTIIKGEPYHHE